jgi:hypothetical protein
VQSTRSLAWNDLVALKSDLPIARSVGDRIRLRHLEDRRDELKKVSYLSLLLLLLSLFFSLSSSLLLLSLSSSLLLLLLFFFSFISSSSSSLLLLLLSLSSL